MAVITRVFQRSLGAYAGLAAPWDAGNPVPFLVDAGDLVLPDGDPVTGLGNALACATRAGLADRITLLADGATLRILVATPESMVPLAHVGSAMSRQAAPPTLPQRLLEGVLGRYGIPFEVLVSEYLPECRTHVVAVRLAGPVASV